MMTYKEYIAAHRRYYGQFVNQRTIDTVVLAIGADRLLASISPDFNDIPPDDWGSAACALPLAASLSDAGDYWRRDGAVCIAKEAARQFVESRTQSGGSDNDR